ncbi:CBS domain-containing protein, partial [Streptomyces sp. DT18]
LDEPARAVPQRLWHRMITLRAELPHDDALTVMRRAATHLAQVADARGRVLGLVTLEDALELRVRAGPDPAHRLPEPGRAT